jgi:hypothetical protein
MGVHAKGPFARNAPLATRDKLGEGNESEWPFADKAPLATRGKQGKRE